MTLLEEEYYKRWIEQVQENKKLKFEIERMKKIEEYNLNFREELLFCRREIKRYEKAIKSLKLRLQRYQDKLKA